HGVYELNCRVKLVRAIFMFFCDSQFLVTDSTASIENVLRQSETAIVRPVLVANRALELLNSALIQVRPATGHPPFKRMVPLDLDLDAVAVLRLPRIHMRAAILRRVH